MGSESTTFEVTKSPPSGEVLDHLLEGCGSLGALYAPLRCPAPSQKVLRRGAKRGPEMIQIGVPTGVPNVVQKGSEPLLRGLRGLATLGSEVPRGRDPRGTPKLVTFGVTFGVRIHPKMGSQITSFWRGCGHPPGGVKGRRALVRPSKGSSTLLGGAQKGVPKWLMGWSKLGSQMTPQMGPNPCPNPC